jgi:nucleoside-diphosphate-sugar epimerase
MIHILVTGGAGYIGSVLVPALLQAGHHVTVVDNFLYRQATLADCCHFDGFEVVRCDCRDHALMRPLVSKADYLIPLAALVGAPLCERDRTGAETINRDAVRMLCELASSTQRILFPTTNSGYGIGQKDVYCTEETPLRPISLYGRTKTDAEQAILERGNCITFRLATVFGISPRMRTDLLVNDFVYRAVYDRAVVLFEGHFRRNFIHVRDVARAFLHAIERFESMQGLPYNVGLDDTNLSKLELCERIKAHLPEFVYLEAPIGKDTDQRDYLISNARIAGTGFRPGWSLDRGIRELIKGYSVLHDRIHTNV